MTQFTTIQRTVGGYPNRWRAAQVLQYHEESDSYLDWRIEERSDGLHWVVGSSVLPDEPLLDEEAAYEDELPL